MPDAAPVEPLIGYSWVLSRRPAQRRRRLAHCIRKCAACLLPQTLPRIPLEHPSQLQLEILPCGGENQSARVRLGPRASVAVFRLLTTVSGRLYWLIPDPERTRGRIG